jgi:hypothetical protein
MTNEKRIGLLFLVFIFLNSCGPMTIDEEIIGTWNSKKHKITVRTEPEKMKFKFLSDSTFTTLTINSDKTVSGNIGLALIENGNISTNWLLPSGMTGVAFTIKCNLKGKIFEKDPLDSKEVQFWISPQFNESDWELRFTTKGAQFPMAFIYFDKQDSK